MIPAHHQIRLALARQLRHVGCGLRNGLNLRHLPAHGAQFILQQTENRELIEETLPLILGITLILVSIIILARTFRLLGPKEIIEIKWPAPWALVLIGAIGGALVGMTSIWLKLKYLQDPSWKIPDPAN